MELWNTRKLKAPPTFTCPTNSNVDIDHLRLILQDGIKFYKEQDLINVETALLNRIIYRMKSKFRNSKDFQSLEKVKKDLMIFSKMDIFKNLEHLMSVLPSNPNDKFLPTKNMVDFSLVRLQGVGKILCRVLEMCKLTAEFYECRLRLGHFWKLAIIALGIVSRIYILSLNIIKFTCLLYVRLLPFSHKLKNPHSNWLPEDYIFPKDLQEWLNVKWTEFGDIIEIPDIDLDIPFFDLSDYSEDDEVEFCNEYVEIKEEDEDLEIIDESTKFRKRKIDYIDLDSSVISLRGFSAENVDTGEVISSDEEDPVTDFIPLSTNTRKRKMKKDSPASLRKKRKVQKIPVIEQIDLGEVISSSDDQLTAGSSNNRSIIKRKKKNKPNPKKRKRILLRQRLS